MKKKREFLKKDGKTGQKQKASYKSYKKEFTELELKIALENVKDKFSVYNLRFILAGDTCRGVIEKRLFGTELTLVIIKTSLTRTIRKNLSVLVDDLKFSNTRFRFKENGVPVVVYMVNKQRKYFRNPDIAWYDYESYYIPNPVKKYLSRRSIL